MKASSKPKVVLVCGGRDYNGAERLFQVLAHYASAAEVIVHGGASGADALAQRWADTTGHCCMVYPADWKKHGKAAGPIRNQLMLDSEQPDLVLAFPGGRGTADMVKRARAAGIKVLEL